MGNPKFARPKTQTPTHPWKAARIEEEHALKEQFGLKKSNWRPKNDFLKRLILWSMYNLFLS